MTVFVLRRLLQAAVTMLAMSTLVFLAIFAIGDPVAVFIPPNATEEAIQATIRQFGLDRPLWAQYWTFLGNVFSGDLGTSWVHKRPAVELMLERVPATLELALGALVLSFGIGVPVGLWISLKPRSRASGAVMWMSLVLYSMPTFWIAMVLIAVLGVELQLLPVFGRGETVEVFGIRTSLATADGLAHLFLPALCLAIGRICLMIRFVRSGAREVLLQDYIRFARAKGLTERRIIGVHVAKNILIPIVTLVGLDFASLVAFGIVIETVFSWPGMGKLIIDSINVLDRPVVVAYLMVTVLIFVTANLVVDLLYRALDPRVSFSGALR